MSRTLRVLAPVVGPLVSACMPQPSHADAFARGQDATLPLHAALAWCAQAGEAADRCVVGAVRAHPEAPVEACARARNPGLRAECHFSRAEAHARDGDRWSAVAACADASTFGDECLYHAWSLELQHVAEEAPDTQRAWEALQEPLAWWSGLQTVGPDPYGLLVRDAWYFLGVVAQARGTPLGWETCEGLSQADRGVCREGVAHYVGRATREGLRRASDEVRDPLCRRLDRDPAAALKAREALGVSWSEAPELRARYETALREGCRDPEAPRTWNPVFQPRQRSYAGPT